VVVIGITECHGVSVMEGIGARVTVMIVVAECHESWSWKHSHGGCSHNVGSQEKECWKSGKVGIRVAEC